MIRRTPDLDDLDREIRDHIDAETQDNVARGMPEDEARAAAIRKFGNVTRVKEDVRELIRFLISWLTGIGIPFWFRQIIDRSQCRGMRS